MSDIYQVSSRLTNGGGCIKPLSGVRTETPASIPSSRYDGNDGEDNDDGDENKQTKIEKYHCLHSNCGIIVNFCLTLGVALDNNLTNSETVALCLVALDMGRSPRLSASFIHTKEVMMMQASKHKQIHKYKYTMEEAIIVISNMYIHHIYKDWDNNKIN